MIARSDIKRYCRTIAREFSPAKIVLFGSYAYGRPTADSDVDVLVVMTHKRGRRPSLEIRQRVHAGFPVDIIVRTPEDVARRLREGDSFLTEVMSRGDVLYEAGDA